jgi:hypothetical protein
MRESHSRSTKNVFNFAALRFGPQSAGIKPDVCQCQGVGLYRIQSCTRRPSSMQENRAAQDHLLAVPSCKDSRRTQRTPSNEVLLVAVTGMRATELFGLKWSDADFGRRLLFVRRTYYRGEFRLPKNETSERHPVESRVACGPACSQTTC